MGNEDKSGKHLAKELYHVHVPSMHLLIRQPANLSVYQISHLPVIYLSIYLSICLSVSLSK